MFSKKYYITALFATALATTFADNLTKEIVVEKDYVPVEQKATKMNESPSVVKLETQAKSLNVSNWNVPSNTGNAIPVMLPYGYKTTHKFDTHRGYLNFGIGTNWNMVGSAGYQILDKEKTKLNVWLQHNSSWNAKIPFVNTFVYPAPQKDEFNQKYINDYLGVDFSHDLGKNIINANAYYHFARNNFMVLQNLENTSIQSFFNNVNEINLDANLTKKSAADAINYLIGIGYNHFGKAISDKSTSAINENNFNLYGTVSMPSGETSRIGLDLDANYLYYAQRADELNANKGKVRLTPYYNKETDKLNLRLGLNMDLSISDGTFIRFSPDVKLDYKFLNYLSAFIHATGGKNLNTQADFFTITPYIFPQGGLESSYTPVNGKIGLNFGTFHDFTAKVWGGYALNNSSLLPIAKSFDISFYPIDAKGAYLGAELSYSYLKYATLTVTGEYAIQNNSANNALGFDLPTCTLIAKLSVNPIEKLAINVDYELRAKRKFVELSIASLGDVSYIYNAADDVNNLSIGASYQITNMIGVFAQASNILNKSWYNVPYYGTQKFNIVGGFALKF